MPRKARLGFIGASWWAMTNDADQTLVEVAGW
jgi:hypothetical protein